MNSRVVDMLEGEALSFETKPGKLYILVPEGSSWDSIEVEELRNDGGIKPRRITEKDAELHGSTVNYYPESPPSCQPLDDGWIYLGLPNKPSNKGLMEDSVNLIKMLDDEYWTIRQDAARRLAHCKPTRETISALAKIAASDEAQVVRVTAAVSLINLRTPEAIKMVIKTIISSKDEYFKREAVKAIARKIRKKSYQKSFMELLTNFQRLLEALRSH